MTDVKIVSFDRESISFDKAKSKIFEPLSNNIITYGDSCEIIHSKEFSKKVEEKLENTDVVIIQGTWCENINFNVPDVYKFHNKIYNFCKQKNKKLLVIETQTLSRVVNQKLIPTHEKYHRIGLNHWLYGKGKFIENTCDSRWLSLKKQYNLKPKSWKSKGEYILILLGFTKDPTNEFENPLDFTKKILKEIINKTDKKIIIKPHNYDMNNRKYVNSLRDLCDFKKVFINKELSLEYLLKNSFCAIMNNSTAIFQTIYAGVPCFTSEYNFGKEISLPLSELHLINSPIYPDRKEWFHKMAWTQYTRQEVKEPYFWDLVSKNLLI